MAFLGQKRIVMHSKFYQQTFPQISISPYQFLVSFQCLSYLELCIYVLPIITIKSIEYLWFYYSKTYRNNLGPQNLCWDNAL